MTNIVPIVLVLMLSIIPSSDFSCDNYPLHATIRNNLNGDFELVKDIERIDQGAFVTLSWKEINLMLPISFQAGEISFTDKKWLWSYKDEKNGLRMDNPRFAHLLPNGEIQEFSCQAISMKESVS